MHKILLVHDERYLDRALEDVLRLLELERQLTRQEKLPDLLAVILTPLTTNSRIDPQDRMCEPGCLTNHVQFFSPESVTVNGIWSLLTISQEATAVSTRRHETLSRILNVLQHKEGSLEINAVIPVFASEESYDSMAAQIAYLESRQRSIRIVRPLTIDFKESPPTLSKSGLLAVPE